MSCLDRTYVWRASSLRITIFLNLRCFQKSVFLIKIQSIPIKTGHRRTEKNQGFSPGPIFIIDTNELEAMKYNIFEKKHVLVIYPAPTPPLIVSQAYGLDAS